MKDNNKYSRQINLGQLQKSCRIIVEYAFYSIIFFLLFATNNSFCQEKIIQLKASREIQKSDFPRVEIIPNFLSLNDENQLLYKAGIIYLTSQTEVLKIDVKRKSILNRINFQKLQNINNSTIDKSGNLWFISQDSLYIVDPLLRKVEYDSKEVNPISIICNKTGEIYLLTRSAMLAASQRCVASFTRTYELLNRSLSLRVKLVRHFPEGTSFGERGFKIGSQK